jgi:hypothetical protein
MQETHTEEATNVAAVLEEGEDAVLERETAVACEEMRIRLKLTTTEVAHFVNGATSGLTPRRSAETKRHLPDLGNLGGPGAKGVKSSIMRPTPLKK